MELFNSQKKAIDKAVDNIFYRLSARLLGRFFKGPKIFFQVVSDTNPLNTLEAVFHYTMNMTAGPTKFDKRNPKKLAEITSNYIEAERLKTKNRIQMAIAGAEDIDEVEEAVSEEIDKATKYVDLLIDTEIRQHQSIAEKVGIEKVSASLGIEDPVVCKFGVIDNKLCDNCKKLWHTENLRIPKVYKMSELSSGYNTDWKNPIPTVGTTHPHCRHIMTFIPPNFGFDKSGALVFKGLGYDIWEEQRGQNGT